MIRLRLAGLAFLLAGSFLTVSSEAASSIEIEACAFHLTDAGRAAAFSDTAIYALKTNPTGAVETLSSKKVGAATRALVDLEGAEACIRRWRLEPSTTYSLAVFLGTTGNALENRGMRLSGGSLNLKVVPPRETRSPKAP